MKCVDNHNYDPDDRGSESGFTALLSISCEIYYDIFGEEKMHTSRKELDGNVLKKLTANRAFVRCLHRTSIMINIG